MPDGARFCPSCGSPTPRECPSGHVVRTGSSYCSACGLPVSPETTVAAIRLLDEAHAPQQRHSRDGPPAALADSSSKVPNSSISAEATEMAAMCGAGHLLRPNASFCSVCGSPVLRPCPNGHALGASATFCPDCGEPAPSGVTAESIGATAHSVPSDLATASSHRRRRRVALIGGTIAGALAVGVVIGIAATSGNPSPATGNALAAGGNTGDTGTAASPTTLSPADQCYDILLGWTLYLLHQGVSDAALETVQVTLGGNSGIPQWVDTEAVSIISEADQEGFTSALDSSFSVMRQECTTLINGGFDPYYYSLAPLGSTGSTGNAGSSG